MAVSAQQQVCALAKAWRDFACVVAYGNDTRASGGALLQPATGWTLWVKSTHVAEARYAASRQVDPVTSVDEFISRWVAELKLDCHPSLVRLHLVPCPCDGEEEPTPEQEAAATVLPPHKTLAQAGVTDGSWLLGVVVSQTAATEGELHDDLRSLSPRSVSLSHSPGVSLRAPMRLSRSLYRR